MTNNPISLHHSGQITASQLSAFNTLLTQLAAIVDLLERSVSRVHINQEQVAPTWADDIHQDRRNDTKSQTDEATAATVSSHTYRPESDTTALLESTQLNWHCLLRDLKTVVLPEFYVVFNDPTTLAMARRQLYDLTQAIFFTLKRYLEVSLATNTAMASGNSADNLHNYQRLDGSTSTVSRTASDHPDSTSMPLISDNYATAEGRNAKVAKELLDLSQFIAVDGVTYIEQFEPYYSKLIEIKTLEEFLQSHSQPALITQLEVWQRSRLKAFSLIEPRKAIQDYYMVNNTIDHPLAKWAISEVNGEALPPIPTPKDHPLVSQSTQSLIAHPQHFRFAATLFTIGLGLLMLGSLSSLGLISLLGMVVTFTGVQQGVSSLNFAGYQQKVASWTTKAMLVSFFMMIFTPPLLPIALVTFALSIWIKVINNNQRLASPDSTLALPDKSPQMLGEIEATRLEPETPQLETLSFDQHAYQLGVLLSEGPTERLKQLMAAMNELRDNLGYLQQTYPYLATRVEELINDLRQNTIIRLNELASRFVKGDKVSDEVRALFVRQHESRIDALIRVNLKQVKDLNQTILEKRMAVFSEVGSDQERQFRDTIMELKILLRWLIAQQPDELQATSHQVILDSLESTTLKDMQMVFFDNTTTREQRQDLLDQVVIMLHHFKRQSPYSLDITSAYDDSVEQDQELSNLLKLSHSKESPFSADSLDQTLEQAQAQKFIDFNKAYVAELIKYWR